MTYIADTFEHNGYTIKIMLDEDGSNADPRDAENLGVMFTTHPRYNLGDEDVSEFKRAAEYFYERASSRAAFERMFWLYLKIYHGATTILTLGLYDHSGISMYVGKGHAMGDPSGWDSSQVGWIFDTGERRAVTGLDNPEDIAAAGGIRQALIAEVEVYDQFLRGEVYGYVIEDADGETVESVWGFLGDECVVEEAKAVAGALEPLTEHKKLTDRRTQLVARIDQLNAELAEVERRLDEHA